MRKPYYSRRRNSAADMELLLEMVRELARARSKGTWGLAHSFLLAGMAMFFLGFICFMLNIILGFAGGGINPAAIGLFFGAAAAGVFIMLGSWFVIRLRRGR
ncbi:vitamin K epoxide reductase family protein [Paenibacillus lycopersici]|uniref:Vitamin K epoxide reductase family protein n=1 Tax=Paenibacillus lycopersici TaxID=2704462 RepID=A0A6C0FSQ9_9BACL|nr:vitamin K epoxide reductase family protein [Paenibacillus lycopersici]QHT59122.1 vitamin K epoxide reductase family protein [Paenibacillus lycopersici]